MHLRRYAAIKEGKKQWRAGWQKQHNRAISGGADRLGSDYTLQSAAAEWGREGPQVAEQMRGQSRGVVGGVDRNRLTEKYTRVCRSAELWEMHLLQFI